MRKKNKYAQFIVVIGGSLLVFCITFLLRYDQPLELFPGNNTLFEFEGYSDGDYENGYSEAHMDTAHGHLHFNYRLSSQSELAYAQVLFHAHGLHKILNLKKYKYVEIGVDTIQTDEFLLTLFFYVPHFSEAENTNTHRPYSIKYMEGRWGESIRVPLSALSTPLWWFTGNEIPVEDLPDTDWGQLTHLSISECSDSPKDTDLQISLTSLSFRDSLWGELGIAFIFSVLSGILITVIQKRLFKMKNRKIQEKIYYRSNNDEPYSEAEAEGVVSYIAENYSDPLLTLDKIQKKTGVNSFIVNEIVMSQFSMSYKKYVIFIRIDESKRLLVDTNRSVALIAEQVGYCYSNSFSRSFRNLEGITPLQYRIKNLKRREQEVSGLSN